jgi:hypothetical protein
MASVMFDGLVRMELGGLEREYLQVSYARGDKLYVPVHQADRLSAASWARARSYAARSTRLGTADWAHGQGAGQEAPWPTLPTSCSSSMPRARPSGARLSAPTRPGRRRWRRLPLPGNRRPVANAVMRHQARHGVDDADGSPDLRRRGLWQDRSRDARRLQGHHGRQAGGLSGADHRAGAAALSQHLPRRLRRFPVRIEVFSRFRTPPSSKR